MNLNKLLLVPNTKVEVNHWYLSEVNHSFSAKAIVLKYVGYTSKADRQEGDSPVKGARISYIIKNWSETVVDEEGVETVIEHKDYNKFKTTEYRIELKASVLKHIRILARQQDLQDATDD